MNDTFFQQRLSALIMKANVSESQMSKDLGFDRSYINNITSGRSLPQMQAFFRICAYLRVTPEEFFHSDAAEREEIQALERDFLQLDDEAKIALRDIVNKLKQVD